MITEDENSIGPFSGYVADVHVSSIQCLQAGISSVGRTAAVTEIARENKAVLAINGDFFHNMHKGLIVRNGVVLRRVIGTSDLCVLGKDGVMKKYEPGDYSAEEILEMNPWQVWSFGPALLDCGLPRTEFNTSSAISRRNPRTAIGYYEPGHYCFVVIDGRSMGGSKGASMKELARLMSDLGCAEAYNLDGVHQQ